MTSARCTVKQTSLSCISENGWIVAGGLSVIHKLYIAGMNLIQSPTVTQDEDTVVLIVVPANDGGYNIQCVFLASSVCVLKHRTLFIPQCKDAGRRNDLNDTVARKELYWS